MFVSKKSKDRVRLLLKLMNTSVVAELTTSNKKIKRLLRILNYNKDATEGIDEII